MKLRENEGGRKKERFLYFGLIGLNLFKKLAKETFLTYYSSTKL